jgi:catechol 2,3-dioxygenase-like lactoylglutathione lyase family enzyme
MLADSAVVAFASTTDLDRARRFYEDVLGLRLVEQSDFACVFGFGPATLRVTLVGEVVAAPYTTLGWVVADIEGEMRALADRGVAFERYDGMTQDAAGVWTTPGGDRVAWFRDPDGNTLSLTQTTG